ncbi:hypothetical protein D3C73_1042760 [compost metagenome]
MYVAAATAGMPPIPSPNFPGILPIVNRIIKTIIANFLLILVTVRPSFRIGNHSLLATPFASDPRVDCYVLDS